jgi:hypothetical protein
VRNRLNFKRTLRFWISNFVSSAVFAAVQMTLNCAISSAVIDSCKAWGLSMLNSAAAALLIFVTGSSCLTGANPVSQWRAELAAQVSKIECGQAGYSATQWCRCCQSGTPHFHTRKVAQAVTSRRRPGSPAFVTPTSARSRGTGRPTIWPGQIARPGLSTENSRRYHRSRDAGQQGFGDPRLSLVNRR